MNEILNTISNIGLVPVVAIDDPKDAKPLAQALIAGGLPCAEVTFRTAGAEEAIRIMSESFPEMLVGAGTVLTCEQVDTAVAAGAKFIVSPGLNPAVVAHCIEKGIPMVPGVATPSEIEQALSLGLDTVKFFPAESAGGIKMIKAMSAPYSKVRFMPTGGINAGNLCDYLAFDKVIACGGSWMVQKKLIADGAFDEIERLTREAVSVMLGFELGHIGINGGEGSDAVSTANRFEELFSFGKKEGEKSCFAGGVIEVMKNKGLGENGHIAIKTGSIERAAYYLARKGVTLREDTIKRDAAGRITNAYLSEEIGGFAIHLSRK